MESIQNHILFHFRILSFDLNKVHIEMVRVARVARETWWDSEPMRGCVIVHGSLDTCGIDPESHSVSFQNTFIRIKQSRYIDGEGGEGGEGNLGVRRI